MFKYDNRALSRDPVSAAVKNDLITCSLEKKVKKHTRVRH